MNLSPRLVIIECSIMLSTVPFNIYDTLNLLIKYLLPISQSPEITATKESVMYPSFSVSSFVKSAHIGIISLDSLNIGHGELGININYYPNELPSVLLLRVNTPPYPLHFVFQLQVITLVLSAASPLLIVKPPDDD